MKIKERLIKIPELKIPDIQTDDYEKKINEFIDRFPAHEAELRCALDKKDITAISGIVKNLSNILSGIYADDLAADSLKHANTFSDMPFDKIKAYASYLLTTLASLSIDIQMAIYIDENKEKKDADKALSESSGEEKIILAVDDDAFCLDMLRVALKELPYKVVGVTSGEVALDILNKYEPVIFILDIDMPGMNGMELAGKIKKAGYTEPVVFITGNVDKSYVVNAVKAGGQDFILKPIKHQNVLNRIKKFL
jgi:CheY-like chemotaxis protein